MLSRKVDELDPWVLQEKIEDLGHENLKIVDVREFDEFMGDLGHIKNSLNIPVGSLPKNIHLFKEFSGMNIVFVCNTGDRSYFACRYMQDNGFSNVAHLKGGLVQWHLSGLEVEYE